jgi:hypothetical protein
VACCGGSSADTLCFVMYLLEGLSFIGQCLSSVQLVTQPITILSGMEVRRTAEAIGRQLAGGCVLQILRILGET